MDEIDLALHCNLLEPREMLEFLNKIAKKTDVVLTGRYSSKELIERADFVNEVKYVKHQKEMLAIKGIQY